MDEQISWTVYQNMKLFFQGNILPDHNITMQEDIMPSLLEEKKRREATPQQE